MLPFGHSYCTVSTNFNKAIDNPDSGKSYFLPTKLTQQVVVDITKYIFGHMMMQMMAKAGIKHFGQAAIVELIQEFAQLEDLDFYEALDSKPLMQIHQQGALRAINLIKQK